MILLIYAAAIIHKIIVARSSSWSMFNDGEWTEFIVIYYKIVALVSKGTWETAEGRLRTEHKTGWCEF